MSRPDALQSFLETALGTLDGALNDPAPKRAFARIHQALDVAGPCPQAEGSRLPVCAHLAQAADPDRQDTPSLKRLVTRFQALEPMLNWARRSGGLTQASANFVEGHANAVIVGPEGLERRSDVWLGVSLLAPEVRYPDHSHPPEEIYLALTDGAFRHGADGWVKPGPGGTFHNPPGILHTMRSGPQPLLAFWFLLDETVNAG